MANIRSFLILLSFAYMPSCLIWSNIEAVKASITLPAGKATVFIHGTIFPFVSPLMNLGKIPEGLIPLSSCTNRYKRIGKILTQTAPEHFPQETFYYFGWSGNLNFNERKKASLDLYNAIRHHTGPLTVIAHSHGCNVVLYLAQIAEEQKNSTFKIDSLILLAAPVQLATAEYIASPIFKKIISLYSTADIIQVADPQGIYTESKKVSIDRKLPLFSRRRFPDVPHLTQARILLDRQSPAHIDFIQRRFLRRLPEVINLLNTAAQEEERHIIINIPPQSKPHRVKDKLAYVPRGVRGRVTVPPIDRVDAQALNT